MLIICLHTVKWLQVLLLNTNDSIQHYSLICTHKYLEIINCVTNNSIKQSFVYTQ